VVSRPQTSEFTKQVLSQLKADTIIYTHKLEKVYSDKQEEMISDLDHYHSKASKILEELIDDFYIHTIPFTIPQKLTEYIDQHLEERVAELLNNKINEMFDKSMTDIMENKIEDKMTEKYNDMMSEAINKCLKASDINRQLERLNQTIQQADTIRTELFQMTNTSHVEMICHKNIITAATDAAKTTIDKYGQDTQGRIQAHTKQAIQNIWDTTGIYTTDIHRMRNDDIRTLADHVNKACKGSKSREQGTTSKQHGRNLRQESPERHYKYQSRSRQSTKGNTKRQHSL
jgi:hypothetical protein